MNKTLILVLAICLISVQAFVKRDATEDPNGFEKMKKDISNTAETVGNKIKEMLSPENIKKNFDELAEGLNKTFTDLIKKDAPKAEG